MLSDSDVERLFEEWRTPATGRALVRKIRANSPVRKLQHRMDGVRTRFISAKMERAVYAESRTCELPGLHMREYDPGTSEYWPQPCLVECMVRGPNGGSARLSHTPDLFIICDEGLVIEEWRERERLERLARDRPRYFYQDEENFWHYLPMEKYFAERGLVYRLRCSDEHPRLYLSNLTFLEEYSLESTPPVPPEERERLCTFMEKHKKVPHLSLVLQEGFKADHIFQSVLDGTVYVDLYATFLRKTDELIIYASKTIALADAILRLDQSSTLPASAFNLAAGETFLYDGTSYEVVLLGANKVTVREALTQRVSTLDVSIIQQLFDKTAVQASEAQRTSPAADSEAIFNEKRLGEAVKRLYTLEFPETASVTARTLRRWKKKVAGIPSSQQRLNALVTRYPGNTSPRLSPEVLAEAEETLSTFHNKPAKPTTLSSYLDFVGRCSDAGLLPMSRAAFYRWISSREDVEAREGKRMAYQKAPIPLTFEYGHPVHGYLPHEVCYCDHTILNEFLKGPAIENLGKPTITVMVDGSLSKVRAFFLSYKPASSVSVLMCLRDYVRRNGRLPRLLVLDNGKEFHSDALLRFCSAFGITIRWRRRSRPRDSTMVERMLGVTEQEVIAQHAGNSLALKDPRMVSSTHHPDKHISWTLPALHGALEYFFVEIHAKRIHPRFGMSPNDYEQRLILECGARAHMFVRYDATFRILTSPHSGSPTRTIDRQRGVFVDGVYYWHDKLALAKPGEKCVVRVELWNAQVVYVNFHDNVYVAIARDGGDLSGRFRQEFEQQQQQQREEAKAARNASQKDKVSAEMAKKKVKLWSPQIWDQRLREQCAESYYLYERLGMTEALPDARNAQGIKLDPVRVPKSELEAIYAIEREPGGRVSNRSEDGVTTDRTPALATVDDAAVVLHEDSTTSDDDYF